MREIKFRAWSNHEQKMYQDTSSHYNIGGEVNPWIYMQFTGLHDKKGKEIFEGDIIKALWEEKNKLKGEVVWADEFCGYAISDGNFNYRISATASGLREVIGNVYENPELISDKTKQG